MLLTKPDIFSVPFPKIPGYKWAVAHDSHQAKSEHKRIMAFVQNQARHDFLQHPSQQGIMGHVSYHVNYCQLHILPINEYNEITDHASYQAGHRQLHIPPIPGYNHIRAHISYQARHGQLHLPPASLTMSAF